MIAIPLSEIAHGRSGDKGNHANIAVIAYTPLGYEWIREHLTMQFVAQYFRGLNPTSVERYEAEKLLALNFVLKNCLDGGAARSLRIDSQGKTLALALLQMKIEVPRDQYALLRLNRGATNVG